MVQVEPCLVCGDGVKLTEFCQSVFGFESSSTAHYDGIGSVIKLRRGEACLKLLAPDRQIDGAAQSDPWFSVGGWRSLTLFVDERDEVDRLADAVIEGGGSVLMPPLSHRPDARSTLVTDPEGNIWELLWEQDRKE